MSRGVTPGEPGLSNGCQKNAQQLSNRQTVAPGAEIRPSSPKIGRLLANNWATLDNIWSTSTELGQTWPNVAQIRPTLFGLRQIGADFGQHRPTHPNVCPTHYQLRPNVLFFAEIGQISPNLTTLRRNPDKLEQTWSKFAALESTLTGIGHIVVIIGQVLLNLGQISVAVAIVRQPMCKFGEIVRQPGLAVGNSPGHVAKTVAHFSECSILSASFGLCGCRQTWSDSTLRFRLLYFSIFLCGHGGAPGGVCRKLRDVGADTGDLASPVFDLGDVRLRFDWRHGRATWSW